LSLSSSGVSSTAKKSTTNRARLILVVWAWCRILTSVNKLYHSDLWDWLICNSDFTNGSL